MAEVVHVGAVPFPCEVKNWPDVPNPVTVFSIVVPFPRSTWLEESVVEPVPPLATVRVVPFHVPVVIVPIDTKFSSVVMEATEVVLTSILSLSRLLKFVLMTPLEPESVSVPCIVVIVVPNFCSCTGPNFSINERGV